MRKADDEKRTAAIRPDNPEDRKFLLPYAAEDICIGELDELEPSR